MLSTSTRKGIGDYALVASRMAIDSQKKGKPRLSSALTKTSLVSVILPTRLSISYANSARNVTARMAASHAHIWGENPFGIDPLTSRRDL
jgi:hypothetical protein